MKLISKAKRRIMARAKVAVQHDIRKNFKLESFNGRKWKPRKSKIDNAGRRLLTKTRNMERSLRVDIQGGTLVVQTNTKYAQIHNEGGKINHPGGTPYMVVNEKSPVKGKSIGGGRKLIWLRKNTTVPNVKKTKPHGIEIPQRQFAGVNPRLESEIKKILNEELRNLGKSFFSGRNKKR